VTRAGEVPPTAIMLLPRDCVHCEEIPPCPPCGEGQVCTQTYPSDCTRCPENVCVVDTAAMETRLHVGAIVGGAVGGFVGLVCLLTASALLLRWRRKRTAMQSFDTPLTDKRLSMSSASTIWLSQEKSTSSKSDTDAGAEDLLAEQHLSCISEHTEPEDTRNPPLVREYVWEPPVIQTIPPPMVFDDLLCENDDNPHNPFAGFAEETSAATECSCGKYGMRFSMSGTASTLCETCRSSLYTSIPLSTRRIRFSHERTEITCFPSVLKRRID